MELRSLAKNCKVQKIGFGVVLRPRNHDPKIPFSTVKLRKIRDFRDKKAPGGRVRAATPRQALQTGMSRSGQEPYVRWWASPAFVGKFSSKNSANRSFCTSGWALGTQRPSQKLQSPKNWLRCRFATPKPRPLLLTFSRLKAP